MLHLVETQRVCTPETIAAMTAAFDRLCKSIPMSVSGDDRPQRLSVGPLSNRSCSRLRFGERTSCP
jgi:hypothetical protein